MPIGGGSIVVTTVIPDFPAIPEFPEIPPFPDFPDIPDEVRASIVGVYGKWKQATITYEVGGDNDLTAEVDLGAPFSQLQMEIPVLDFTNVGIEVCRIAAGTFKRLGDGSALIQCGEGDFMTTAALLGYRYIKIKTTAKQSADRIFVVRGSNV